MRLEYKVVKRIIERYPPEVGEIVMGVREAVFAAVPDAWERPKMGGIAYFLEENSSPLKGMICHVCPEADCVRVGFIFGAFMPDPEGLLEGKQKAKRFMVLREYEQVPWEPVEDLMRAAAEVDSTSFS